MRRGRKRETGGFTLVELLIATLVMLEVFVAVVLGLVQGLAVNELSRDTALALSAARHRLAEIENAPFSQVHATYHNTTFTTPGLDGLGTVRVDDSDPKLLVVSATVCWREKDGRVIGEDRNLNGILLSDEDDNGNGVIDSPVQLTTLISADI